MRATLNYITKIYLIGGFLFYYGNSYAQDYDKIFKGFANNKLQYTYVYAGNEEVAQWSHPIPVEVTELLVKKYQIPDVLRPNLIITSPFSHNGKYLINFGFQWRKKGKISQEAIMNGTIATKHCEILEKVFKGACKKSDKSREAVYAIIDLNLDRLIPIPGYFRTDDGIASILKDDSLDNIRISRAKSRYFSLYETVDAFTSATYGLKIGENRRCLRGQFAWSDFNNDASEDFFLISANVSDDVLEYQVEPKEMAINRVNVAIISLKNGIAKPLITEELFSYEMDYRPYYKTGQGNGIYRDTKLYWGDFNEDGKSDYLIRRRQADLEFTYSRGPNRFIDKPYEETALLYLGTADGIWKEYKPADEQKFLEFITSVTDWEEGFPKFYQCNK